MSLCLNVDVPHTDAPNGTRSDDSVNYVTVGTDTVAHKGHCFIYLKALPTLGSPQKSKVQMQTTAVLPEAALLTAAMRGYAQVSISPTCIITLDMQANSRFRYSTIRGVDIRSGSEPAMSRATRHPSFIA
ncbi:threonine synthase [Echinococcus multilocularis]|uniref:Threonine synthase n=1 Tax=Echinococcus multilocularis TaxID=6211 RepID=A0A0S4MSB5_ECHMU|nr:threonine synthase [Echinococcus multilocularis]